MNYLLIYSISHRELLDVVDVFAGIDEVEPTERLCV